MIVATKAALRQRWTDPDGTLALCMENLKIYKFTAAIEEADDDDVTLRPVLTGSGRWVVKKVLQEYTKPEE